MEKLTDTEKFKLLVERLPNLKKSLETMIDELKINMAYLKDLKDKKPKDNSNEGIIELKQDNFAKLEELANKRVEMKEKGIAAIQIIDQIKTTIKEVYRKFDFDEDNVIKANNDIINEIIERKREENKKEIKESISVIEKEIKKIKDAEIKFEEEKNLWDAKRVDYFLYQRKFPKDYQEHYNKLIESQKDENKKRREVMKSLGINERIFIEVKENQKKANEILLSKYQNIVKNLPKMEEWSQSVFKSVLYNSEVDDNSPKAFLERVLYHNNLYFIVIDDKNNVFGHYHSANIVEVDSEMVDPNIFMFTLFSNGRKKVERYLCKTDKKVYSKLKSYYKMIVEETGYEVSSYEKKGIIYQDIGHRFKGAEQLAFTGFPTFTWSKIIVIEMEKKSDMGFEEIH